jgi:hypothetical protein
MLIKHLTIAAALFAVASSFAADERLVANKFELKDGSTVYVFKDGKMSMEDKVGRPTQMKPGRVMETKDGQRLIMIGNEIARLESLRKEHSGGGQ